MTYVGQQPATTFDSGIQDRFTGLTTNTVTLTHEISAEEDILVVWNNIVQDKNTYSVGGTGNKTLTLGGTLVSADVVTVYYLNKVMQSVNPTAGSVTSTILGSDILSGQTDIGADIADADLFLVDDGAGGTVRKSVASRLKTYIGNNTPAVLATNSGSQSISNNSHTQVTLDTETVDTDGAFASNTYTVPSGKGGMHFISVRGAMQGIDAGEFIQLRVYLNGSASNFFENRLTAYTTDVEFKFSGSGAINLSAGDTIKYYVYQNSGDSQNLDNAGLYIFKLSGA